MPNPYPAIWQRTDLTQERLDGQVTFTDPSNQPGGGGSGNVNSVTAGDASITIAGTVTDPTVAVAANGVTTAKLANLAVTQGKIALASVDAAQMASAGPVTANWVPLADGSGGVAWGVSPGVNSVLAADTSIVIGGTAQGPTVATGTLDVIATNHPPAANWSNNSHKITNLANGTSAQDAAAFGQIPTALPPNGSAGGDLSGTYPNPTVQAIEGVAVSSTPPTANQLLQAIDATHAAWATVSASSPLTTKGDIFGHSTVDARIPVGTNGQVLTADSTQTLGVKWATASSGTSADVQTFSTAGANTWTKPSGTPKMVYVEMIGAGGGGGSGTNSNGTASSGGGGGGGGAHSFQWFEASQLGSTETVTVGTGGTGGAAVTSNPGNAGNDGTATTFGTHLTAGGGGGGAGGAGGSNRTGGGGGSPLNSASGATGGAPSASGGSTAVGYQGTTAGGGTSAGAGSEWGGAGGGNGGNNAVGSSGGSSAYGAPGGGGGGGTTTTTGQNGGTGGTSQTITAGGGAAGGTGGATPTAGTGGATGVLIPGTGAGGGGGGSTGGVPGKDGGNGLRGSGGGGGGSTASTTGTSSGKGGNGGDGYCRVVTYF